MVKQGGLIQDQNNLHYDGTLSGEKISVLNVRKKNTGISKSKNSKTLLTSNQSNASVRKILGDLTNSKKPQSHQASKKTQECKKMDIIIMDDILEVKACEKEGTGELSKSASCMEAKKAVQQTGVRKALGDLTNSQIPNSIEDEGFLHNHDECIKAHKKAEMIDIDYFQETIPMTIGQDKSIKLVSPAPALFPLSKSNENDDDQSNYFTLPNSPVLHRNHSSYSMELEEDDEWEMPSPDFTLKESP